MARQCRGCGARIQTAEPKEYGYVPPHLLAEEGEVICQRCFRISHYGQDEIGPVLKDASWQAITAGVKWAEQILLVVDIFDFEAGLPQELLQLVTAKNVIVVANKADLLPKQTPPDEVKKWATTRLKEFGKFNDIFVVSAINGLGFTELATWIEDHPGNTLVVGVTNVGKSHVLSRLLGMRLGGRRRDKQTPTVSPYPGTTVAWSRWKIAKNSFLADSPGYVPQGRVSDMLCAKCAQSLIPHKKLSSKLYKFAPQDLLYIPGRVGIVGRDSSGEGLLLGYSGSDTEWGKSSVRHLDKWLWEANTHCQLKDWVQHEIKLLPQQDLLIHGLGWVTARKTRFPLQVHLPQAVQFSIRPALIGFKK